MKNNYKKILTLCIVHEHSRVLLAMKKRGFGEGRWNGFGGKVEEGETIEEAAHREIHEESGTRVRNLEKRGIIEFEFEGDPEIQEVHVFRGGILDGEPRETEEMNPKWFYIDEIPFSDMWPDDIHWFPLFLSGKKFEGKFLFGEGDKILNMELSEVNNI